MIISCYIIIIKQCIRQWHQLCEEKNIPVSERFSMSSTLGDPLVTRQWHISGLPVDMYVFTFNQCSLAQINFLTIKSMTYNWVKAVHHQSRYVWVVLPSIVCLDNNHT